MAKNLLRRLASRRVVAPIALVSVASACAPPDRNQQMSNANLLVFDMSLDNFIWSRGNATDWWPYMDWSSDECSAPPLLDNTWWDFSRPCIRHDFSWGNLKRISDEFWAEPSVWSGRNKDAADWRFWNDMYDCGEHGWWYRWACYPDADVYFYVVNIIPPWAWPWEVGQSSFAW